MSRKAVIAVSAVVAIFAAAAALLIAGVGTATADEVRFQNVSDPGPAPFTAPADVAIAPSGEASTSSSSSESSTSESTTDTTESTGSSPSEPTDPSSAGGSEGSSEEEPKPGTFGGTGNNKVCDREKLIEELIADPDKLSAWADTVGIDADAQTVADFIRELTPSTLTQDTQVTNHSFVNGEANAYQAILEKGTAVLVDDDGKFVARCRCGNPLSEPVQLEPETKCYQCAAGYQPPPPCEGQCYRPEPKAPPVKKGPGPVVEPRPGPGPTENPDIAAYQACRASKPNLEKLSGCKAEYEKARQACSKDPLNPKCDASVCLMSVTSPFVQACASYLENIETDIKCEGEPTPAAKAACISKEVDRRTRCAQVPTGEGCSADPATRAASLRKFCGMNPGRPECTALQIGCAKDPSQTGCTELKDKCTTQPERPDCKAATEFLQKCAKTPTLPECKAADPKKALKTLTGEEEPDAQQGDQPTGEEGTGEGTGTGTDTGGETGTGTDTGGDTGGGDTGGGEAPTTEPPPETTPTPEGQ